MHSPRSWFGFPMVLSSAAATEAAKDLQLSWMAQCGNPAEDLVADLNLLRRWFDPKARGERLRRELAAIAPSNPRLGEPFVLRTGEQRHLVTPEGRCLIDLLHSTELKDSSTVNLSYIRASELEATLLGLYREWAQQRLRDVVALQSGAAAPLLPQAIGQVLLLLVNGSIGRRNALAVPKAAADARLLDEAQSAVVESFAEALSPSPVSGRRRSPAMYALRSGYSLTEARRRLGAALVIDGKTRGIFIEKDAEEMVIKRIAEELRRRHPRELERLPHAIDELIAAYEKARPTLAAFGQAHSSPARPPSIKNRLLTAMESAPSEY